MLVLGIESSCDETGVALYRSGADRSRYRAGLLGHALHSQAEMHELYGGVVPELASRDHIRRIVPLVERLLHTTGAGLADVDAIAYTEGPGLAGALLVGAGFAKGLAFSLDVPSIGIHHLEGHLLSPLLSDDPPAFPFIALLVSGGHTQLMRVDGVGRYRLLGETLDDAAGEAFDKVAQLLGLGYPGGPALARLAATGTPGRTKLPRPMLAANSLDFSFSGLKTAASIAARQSDPVAKEDLAAEFQQAVVEVLVTKAIEACERSGLDTLVVAGGVGANAHLRRTLAETCEARGMRVHYPDLSLCTDNGAMIAFAGALRLAQDAPKNFSFSVRPRWDLEQLDFR